MMSDQYQMQSKKILRRFFIDRRNNYFEEYDKKNPQNFNSKRRVSISGFNISDAIILLKWVDYAKGIKDPSLNLFTQDKIYFQDVYDLAKRRKESLKINKKQINLNQIS